MDVPESAGSEFPRDWLNSSRCLVPFFFFLKMAPSVWEVGNTLLNNGPARTVNQGPSLVTATNDRNI
ncbi:unnamed protein product, partial [Nesidiocoris tenuis]